MKKNILIIGLILLLLPGNIFIIFYWYKVFMLISKKQLLIDGYFLKNFNGEYAIVKKTDSYGDDLCFFTKNQYYNIVEKDGVLRSIVVINPKSYFSWSGHREGRIGSNLNIDGINYYDFSGDGLYEYKFNATKKHIAVNGVWVECSSVNFNTKVAKGIDDKEYHYINNKWL